NGFGTVRSHNGENKDCVAIVEPITVERHPPSVDLRPRRRGAQRDIVSEMGNVRDMSLLHHFNTRVDCGIDICLYLLIGLAGVRSRNVNFEARQNGFHPKTYRRMNKKPKNKSVSAIPTRMARRSSNNQSVLGALPKTLFL